MTIEAEWDGDAHLDSILASHDLAEEAPSEPQEAAEPAPEPGSAEDATEPAEAPQEPTAAAPAPTPDPEPTPAAPPSPPTIPPHLAEAQRNLTAAREELAREREAMQADLEALRNFRAVRERIDHNDAFGALRELGIDLNEVNKAALEGRGLKTPTARLETEVNRKLSETERRIEEKMQALQAAEQRRQEAEFVAEATAEIQRLSPLVAALGDDGVNAVYQRFAAEAQQVHPGENLTLSSYEDVVGAVEREVLDFVSRVKEIESVRALFTESGSPPEEAAPTLSNKQAATAPPKPSTTEPEDETDYDNYLRDIELEDSFLDKLVAKHT